MHRSTFGIVLALLLVPATSHAADSQRGTPDPSFGTAGQVASTVPGTVSVLLPAGEGAVYAIGDNGIPYHSLSVSRFFADGSLDTTFGERGVAFTTEMQSPVAALDAEGGILVAGERCGRPTGPCRFAVARLLPDGRLDESFGSGGFALVNLGGRDVSRALLVQPGGRIVVGGTSWREHSGHFALAALDAHGKLDPSFGEGGIVRSDLPGDSQLVALAPLPGGGVVAVGRNRAPGSEFPQVAVACYRADGSLDPGFGERGFVTTDLGPSVWVLGYAAAAQPDGGIVVAAAVTWGSFAVLRYAPDGTLDRNFGERGMRILDLHGGAAMNALLVLPGGEVVAAGSTDGHGVRADFALAYLTRDGDLDPALGAGGSGIVTTDFGPAGATASALALLPDGRLVAAGNAGVGWALARYAAGAPAQR